MYSYFGASFATVVTEAFGLAVGLFILGRNGFDFGFGERVCRPFLACPSFWLFQH